MASGDISRNEHSMRRHYKGSLLKSSWALARLCKKATDSLLQLNEIFNKNSSSKVRAGNLHAWGHGLELLGITHGLVK